MSRLVTGPEMLTPANLMMRFSRVALLGRIIPEIEGLRCVAIAAVLLYHLGVFLVVNPIAVPADQVTNQWRAHLARHGHYGVELFFVISGFVLALPFASHYLKGKPAVELPRYYIRRAVRIVPPYLIILVVFFWGLVWFQGRSIANLAPNFMASAFYMSGLLYAEKSVINPVAWTLEIEVQFYILVPILTLIYLVGEKVVRRLVMVALGYAFIIYQILCVKHGSLWSFTIINFLQYFLVGFLLADAYLCEWSEKASHDWKWDLAAIVAGLPFLHSISDRAGIMRLLLPLMLFMFCLAVLRGVVLRTVLTRPLVVTIGGMCYSAYLIHYQLITTVRYFIHVPSTNSLSVDLLLQFLLIAPILLVTSAVYFALIEKPCMRPAWASYLLLKIGIAQRKSQPAQ